MIKLIRLLFREKNVPFFFLKKIILLLLLVTGVPSLVLTQTTRTEVAPGFFLKKINDPSVPIRISALEINISRPDIFIRSTLAGNNLSGNFETTQSMGRRYDAEDHQVIGALNGDYFSAEPYEYVRNLMIKDDEYVVGKTYSRSQFGIDVNGKPFVGMASFSGKVQFANNQTLSLDGVNHIRGTHRAIVFNRYIGNSTLTDERGVEVLLKRRGKKQIGAFVDFEVMQVEDGVGDMSIPGQDYYVLSAHGNKRNTISENVSTGDIVQLKLGVNEGVEAIRQLVGGGPRLITDGTLPTEWSGLENFPPDHNLHRHPRTAVGISQDEEWVYFVVIDGRQTASRGATMEEAAEIMLDLGAWNAVNLDGGGSSTLIVNDEWVHRPTDSNWQRPVANALIAVLGSEPDPAPDPDPDPTPGMISSLPWFEDFSGVTISDPPHGTELPKGWAKIGEVGVSRWGGTDNTTTNLRFPSPTADPIAIAPEIASGINISATTLSFKAHYATAGDTGDKIHVGFISDPSSASAFKLVETVSIDDTFKEYTVDLSSHSSGDGRRIAFKAERGGSWNTHYIGKIELKNGEGSSAESDFELPQNIMLKQNYPNPFNPATVISYALPIESYVRLSVYDITGRQITSLVEEVQPAGTYDVTWDAGTFSSGIYIYRLEAGGETLTRRMTLVK